LIHIQMNTWITSGEYLVRRDAGREPWVRRSGDLQSTYARSRKLAMDVQMG